MAALLQWVHAANLIDHIVVRFYRSLDGSPVAKLIPLQLSRECGVVHVKVILIEASGVAHPHVATAERRRMELECTAGIVVVNVIPAHVDVVGVRAIHRVKYFDDVGLMPALCTSFP